MRLALTDLFRAKWTNEIHNEWIRNLIKDRPNIPNDFLEKRREMMNMHIRDCLVDGYHELIPTLSLPDPNDRHVLAAAIHSGCSIIVTYNLKDFPPKSINQYGVEALHPDEFIVQLLEQSPDAVVTAMHKHRSSLKNPQKTVDEYLDTLRAQRLTKTILELEKFKNHLLGK